MQPIKIIVEKHADGYVAYLLERRSSNGELTRRRKAWFAQEK